MESTWVELNSWEVNWLRRMKQCILGLVSVGSFENVFIETLFRFRTIVEVVGAQPELEETLVIGRQVNSYVDIGALPVSFYDHRLTVTSSVFV